METVLNLLLMRFALIALVVVVLALGALAVIVVIRRRGRTDEVRAGVERLVDLALARSQARGADRTRRTGGDDNRAALVDTVLRSLANRSRGRR